MPMQVAAQEVMFETHSQALYMVDVNRQEIIYQKKCRCKNGTSFLYKNYGIHHCG